MTIQPISKSEINRFEDFAVRVVCDKVIAPATDTMARLQSKIPFEAKIATSTGEDEGYGRVAYVLCESKERKRQAQLALGGVEELIDMYRRWVALHSYIYYELAKTVASDETWDRKARQLARLQDVHGAGAGSWQNKAFEGFTGDTGFHLPVTEEIREKAKEMVDE